MRLWHEALLPLLPRQQLLGQHRECCALRGLSWGKRHAVVDYVFRYPREYLVAYHERVMAEMARRGYQVEPHWLDPAYRGKRCLCMHPDERLLEALAARVPVYPEHDGDYLEACVENLRAKGVPLATVRLYRKTGRSARCQAYSGYRRRVHTGGPPAGAPG